MEKKISITGKNGTLEGKIVITLDYTSKTIQVHNPSTHDEEHKTFSCHKIETLCEGKRFEMQEEITGESQIEFLAEKMEKSLREKLDFRANNTPSQTFSERMKEKGFN